VPRATRGPSSIWWTPELTSLSAARADCPNRRKRMASRTGFSPYTLTRRRFDADIRRSFTKGKRNFDESEMVFFIRNPKFEGFLRDIEDYGSLGGIGRLNTPGETKPVGNAFSVVDFLISLAVIVDERKGGH
jgi:hypothetical protein